MSIVTIATVAIVINGSVIMIISSAMTAGTTIVAVIVTRAAPKV